MRSQTGELAPEEEPTNVLEIEKSFYDQIEKDGITNAINSSVMGGNYLCNENLTVKESKDNILEEIISNAYKTDSSCGLVVTGNEGRTDKADIAYARTFAYSMAQDICDGGGVNSLSDLFSQPEMDLNYNSSVNMGASWDALSLPAFKKGTSREKSPDNIIATYSLIYSLGQRESSGNFNEGRDTSGNNRGWLTQETGLLQVSANTLSPEKVPPKSSQVLRNIFSNYVTSLTGKSRSDKVKMCLNDKLSQNTESKKFDSTGSDLDHLFKSGSCLGIDKKISNPDFGLNDKLAGCFIDLNKSCPAFHIKYGAAVVRLRRFGNGPLITVDERKARGHSGKRYEKADFEPACGELFKSIIHNKEKICQEMEGNVSPQLALEYSPSSSDWPLGQLNRDKGLANIHLKSRIQSRSGKMTFGNLNEDAFRRRLQEMTDEGKNGCAKGVRQSLNVLFGKSADYGDIDPGGPRSINAKEYNEKILQKWQTADSQYTEVSEETKFKNFDVRVLRPSSKCNNQNQMLRKYGHIEIFFEGRWYSDFKQPASVLDYDPTCFSSKSLYRLTPK